MKEYIEREAVIRLIETEGFNEKYDLGMPKDNDWFCEEVNRIPTADVVEYEEVENLLRWAVLHDWTWEEAQEHLQRLRSKNGRR